MSTDERATAVETYEEFDLGDVTIAMISDPENERAWIQSDVTCSVDP